MGEERRDTPGVIKEEKMGAFYSPQIRAQVPSPLLVQAWGWGTGCPVGLMS